MNLIHFSKNIIEKLDSVSLPSLNPMIKFKPYGLWVSVEEEAYEEHPKKT